MYHEPIPLQGSRILVSHPLILKSFAPPPPELSPPLSHSPSLVWSSTLIDNGLETTGGEGGIEFKLELVTGRNYAPLDEIGVEISLGRNCLGGEGEVRKVVMKLERRITVFGEALGGEEVPLSEVELEEEGMQEQVEELKDELVEFLERRDDASTPTGTSTHSSRNEPSSSSRFNKTYKSTLLTLSTPVLDLPKIGAPRKNYLLQGQIPKSRSIYRYSLGSTSSTSLVSISFWISFKVISLPPCRLIKLLTH